MRWLLCAALAVWASIAASEDRFILLQSTTSTENSGLFAHILPIFEADTGIQVRVVAVGTGQAIRNARNGDGDVLLVHARGAEEAFVAAGFGVQRFDVMYNDFVLIGPQNDPAGIEGMADVVAALQSVARSGALFTSRGDDSGTHLAELRLWSEGGVDVQAASGTWYREVGAGMGGTLNAAIAMDAYVLSDRATWMTFGNTGAHQIVVQGDARLFNQYSVIRVSEKKHPHVNAQGAQAFVDWITGAPGQAAIAGFELDGQPLFFPNAE